MPKQLAKNTTYDPAGEWVFMRCVRAAQERLNSDVRQQYSTHIDTPFARQRVFDCLRDLSCLRHWWPHARSIEALPGGLCGVGDFGVLHVRDEAVLLRVLVFKPARRMVLALRFARGSILLDLACLDHANLNYAGHGSDNGCTVRLSLESIAPVSQLNSLRYSAWMSSLGAFAAEGLSRHLFESPNVRASHH